MSNRNCLAPERSFMRGRRTIDRLPTPALIGVVHLPALPGAANHRLSVDEIIEHALRDARTLSECGFDGLIIENFGDAPFAATTLAPASLATMAVVTEHVRRAVKMSIGLNALRNDACAALGIAAAAGGSFVRVNVHSGVYGTDQGIIEGRAADTLAYRRLLGAEIDIFADVHVKHATPISQPDIAEAARETAYRGLADALIVTGPATGSAPRIEMLRSVVEAVPDRRVFVGSGADATNVAELLEFASGIIVGTSLKPKRDPREPIDGDRAEAFVAASRGGRS